LPSFRITNGRKKEKRKRKRAPSFIPPREKRCAFSYDKTLCRKIVAKPPPAYKDEQKFTKTTCHHFESPIGERKKKEKEKKSPFFYSPAGETVCVFV